MTEDAIDARVVPVFKVHTSRNEAKSREAGRPIYDEKEVVEVRYAGNRQTISVFPAHAFCRNVTRPDGSVETQTYAQRWSAQYRRFKENRQQVQEGTPLEELPFLTQAKRMELKALQIHTAETLAALDGPELKTLGIGGRDLKNQAQGYLDAAKDSAATTKLAKENEELRRQLAELKGETGRFDEMTKAELVDFAEDRGIDVDPKDRKAEIIGAVAGEASAFDSMSDAQLKDWIEERSGNRPRGNPSKATLVRMAEELAGEKG